MRNRFVGALLLFAAVLAAQAPDQTVRLKIVTGDGRVSLGDIDVTLMPSVAPLTVANFLSYVNKGAYNNTVFHRSVPGFIIQTGGYILSGNDFTTKVPQDAAVRNEYNISNTRGTIAMAKLGNNPNSATSEFFFNLADNSSNLNNQNGGFTVFGKVANDASQAVVDRIASQPVPSGIFISPWDAMPLYNYRVGNPTAGNIMVIQSITALNPAPSISSGGVAGASAFGAASKPAPGSYIEIYGSNLAGTTRSWAGSDFTGNVAPTMLDQVQVTVLGIKAYVNFVSPAQVNVQLPEGIPSGDTVPLVLTYNGVSTAAYNLSVREFAGGVLAPASFKVGDKQYVAAQHSATGKFVSNGSIQGVEAAPAVPGETLTLYGTGFGPVTPNTPALGGGIAAGITQLNNAIAVKIGEATAKVNYAGLAPGLVGVYQFNVVVPDNAASGDQALTITQRDEAIAQKLFLSVK
ncbi:MAG: peptidylprolyl isomerase [Acidobacteria bacterium]|nr:peptidylprolyl isomerase [Acidobacteriota bacterium]